MGEQPQTDTLAFVDFSLFWPDHLSQVLKPSLLYGWVAGTSAVCIAGILPMNKQLDRISLYLSSQTSPSQRDDLRPIIVGTVCPHEPPKKATKRRIDEIRLRSESSVWLTVVVDATGLVPAISEIDFRAGLHVVRDRFVVFYNRPRIRSLQYFSTFPLILDLGLVDRLRPSNAHKHETVSTSQSTINSNLVSAKQNQNVDIKAKIAAHVCPAYSDISVLHAESIEYILEKINVSAVAERSVNRHTSSGAHPSSPHTFMHPIKHTSFIASITRIYNHVTKTILSPLIITCIVLFRYVFEIVLYLVNLRIPSPMRASVANISAAMHQVDLRLQQLCFWPWQYWLWRRSATKLSPRAQAQYIGFFNTLWLIANDIIIGLAIGSILVDHHITISKMIIYCIKTYSIDYVRSMVMWLMGWPAGLKLNSELNSFLGELFGWLIMSWNDFFQTMSTHFPGILIVIGHSGIFGATMTLSLLLDLFVLCNLHLHLLYIISAKIYFWQLTVIQSLFTLFRGKKQNALRDRVDSAVYDLDQLLLGACFFTLLVFLMPTVAVYYLLFSICRIAVVAIHAAFEIILAILNHFPLFALMLRVKDPRRLPEGIQFDPCTKPVSASAATITTTTSSSSSSSLSSRQNTLSWIFGSSRRLGLPIGNMDAPSHTYMYMQTVTINVSSIFYQYRYLIDRLSHHYLSPRAFTSIFTGDTIESVPKLEYPTMPARTPVSKMGGIPTLDEVWTTVMNVLTSDDT